MRMYCTKGVVSHMHRHKTYSLPWSNSYLHVYLVVNTLISGHSIEAMHY